MKMILFHRDVLTDFSMQWISATESLAIGIASVL